MPTNASIAQRLELLTSNQKIRVRFSLLALIRTIMTYFPNLLIQYQWVLKNRSCANFTAFLIQKNEHVLPNHPQNSRGEWIPFTFRGHKTYLYQEEYDLIKDVLPYVVEMTIEGQWSGFSQQFDVLARLNDRPLPINCDLNNTETF